MTTKEVANALVEKCRIGQNIAAINELYADHIVSVEPEYSQAPLTTGLDAVRKKSELWYEMVEEIHSGEVSDALVAGNHFSCTMIMDITMKGMGRFTMEEVCVYEVKDGKIVREEFFYAKM